MPVPLLPQTVLDMTQLDRQSMLARIQQLFNQVNPNYEDFSPNYPENLLLEGMVTLMDTHRATMEYRIRQLMWSTLNERLAAIRLGRMSGFSLTGAAAAQVIIRMTCTDAATTAASFTVPAGTRLRTLDPSTPKEYTVIAATTKAPAAAYVDVTCTNATEVTENFTASGSPNQECTVSQYPYIQGSATVSDTIGAFTQVDSFLGLTSGGLPITAGTAVCNLLIDDRGFLTVRFGNGITGRLPSGTISVVYKYGGGVAGAVAAGTRWQMLDTIIHSGSLPANLSFTNTAASTSGVDQMTTDEARVLGPLSMRTINRCVTKEDFEYVAKLIPGVARACLLTKDEDSTINDDEAFLYLVAYGEQTATGMYKPAASATAKIAEVEAQYATTGPYPQLMGVVVTTGSAALKTINVACKIWRAAGTTVVQARDAIESALEDFFAVADQDKLPNDNIDFGAKMLNANGEPDRLVQWSNVFNAVNDATGIRAIDPASDGFTLNSVRDSVTLAPGEFPVLGSVDIYDMYTSQSI